MAQSDLTVVCRAEDNLTPTLRQARKAFEETGNAASTSLERIKEKFDKITNSTAPVKRQLRDIQTLMTQMNAEGMSSTPFYTQMAEEAGRLRDSIADAQAATSAFANDNFKIKAVAESMQLVASAGSVATGVMGLFGVENDKVTQAILKVQSAMAILNGVQSVANLLNKDSALMHRLKQIQLRATTTATQANTVAQTASNTAEKAGNIQQATSTALTGANTAATGANTVATVANTAAQNKWNTAKAIGKAMLGDWTGIILLAGAGIVTYTALSEDSIKVTDRQTESVKANTEAVEEQKTAYDRAKDRMKNYNDAVASSAARMAANFVLMKKSWEELSSASERIQWIRDMQTEFDKLGLSIKSINDAEDAFVRNSDDMMKAFQLRAAQAAVQQYLEDAYKHYFDTLNEMHTGSGAGTFTWAKEGDKLEGKNEIDRWARTFFSSDSDLFYNKESGTFTKLGAENYNNWMHTQSLRVQHYKESLDANEKELQSAVDKAQGMLEDTQKKIGGLNVSHLLTSEDSKSSVATPKSSASQAKKDSENWLRAEISKREQELKDNNYDEAKRNAIKAEITELKKLLKIKEEENRMEEKALEGSIQWYEERNRAIRKELQERAEISDEELQSLKNELELNEKISDELKIQRGLKKPDEKKEPVLSSIGATPLAEGEQRGGRADLRESLSQAQNLAQQAREDLRNKIISPEEAQSVIDDLNRQLQELGLEPLDLKVNIDTGELESNLDRFNSQSKKFDEITATVDRMGSAFNSLGGAVGGSAGEIVSFAGQTLSSVSQIIPEILKLIPAYQAQAIAAGTASAASFAFPANIAAIAAIVATVGSIFAALPKFAEGGIVGGGSFVGDKTLLRANAGEMVLTRSQQGNLWKLLDGGVPETGGALPHTIRLTAKGSDLQAVIDNYNDKRRRQR